MTIKNSLISMSLSGIFGILLIGPPASAATIFGSATPQGFVPGLTGSSEFGNADTNPGSLVCASCDSVVNFTAYYNPQGADWRDAIGVPIDSWQTLNSDPTAHGGDDADPWNDRWVFFYQIENTNPLGGLNAALENFNVTNTTKDGEPSPRNAYANGGIGLNLDISPFNSQPGLDTPNNWASPELDVEKSLIEATGDRLSATILDFTDAGGVSPISSVSVDAGVPQYAGALFEFGDPELPADALSDVLWLSSNAEYAGIIWAETESAGGFGAAGDVAGIKKKVPAPAAFGLFGVGLAGLSARRWLFARR